MLEIVCHIIMEGSSPHETEIMIIGLDNVLRNIKELGGMGLAMLLILMVSICLVLTLHMLIDLAGKPGGATTTPCNVQR